MPSGCLHPLSPAPGLGRPAWCGTCAAHLSALDHSLTDTTSGAPCGLPDSWLLLLGRPEGRPFLLLRRPESDPGARERDGWSFWVWWSGRDLAAPQGEMPPPSGLMGGWKRFCSRDQIPTGADGFSLHDGSAPTHPFPVLLQGVGSFLSFEKPFGHPHGTLLAWLGIHGGQPRV